jgi:hypothetical protein
LSPITNVELSARLRYWPCKRFGNFDKLSVSVGCGSLKVTGGSQENKLVKMIIVVINFSRFILSIFIFGVVFKMPYNDLHVLRWLRYQSAELQTYYKLIRKN